MMQIFYKYQGAGNDFVVIDNRSNTFSKNDTKLVARLCDRRFGIGADGLMLLENDTTSDFKMVYYNSDGNESTMCGNGGRCIVAFAKYLNIFEKETTFLAVDGLHKAIVDDTGLVTLEMIDVLEIQNHNTHLFLNTGSPHHVQKVADVRAINVKAEGSKLRYSDLYGEEGSNINFVEKIDDSTFTVRTYERGVEDETLACGTGVTAVALAMHYTNETPNNTIILNVEGGQLEVSFTEKSHGKYSNIWLKGVANQVFKGEIEC